MQNHWLTAPTPLIIAHRGASKDAPENTLKAFRIAQEQGAHGTELDVWLTADMIPVVIHDQELDRTTDGKGDVTQINLADLAHVDAGEGEPIPTLAQLFETCGDWLYNVEIKDPRPEAVQIVIDVVKTAGLLHKTTVSSFEYPILKRAQATVPPEVAVGFLRYPKNPNIESWFTGEADHPHWTLVDENTAKSGKRVHVWTVDDIEMAKLLLERGVHAIITNTPKVMLDALFE